MTSLQASRTLVKSPPELWAELSDAGTLARHLGEFGEIRITKSHPEARVEWEADRASGTVRLEPTGWGTRVVLTVETPEEAPTAAAAPQAEPDPEHVDLPPAATAEPARRSLWARLFRRPAETPAGPEPAPAPVAVSKPVELKTPASPAPDRAYGTIEWETPEPPAEEEPPPPVAVDPDEAHAVLTGVLDTLGAAHHRPFSRS